MQDGELRNGYEVKVLNMTPQERQVVLTVEGLPGATMWLGGTSATPQSILFFPLEPDKVLPLKLYVKAPLEALTGAETPFTIDIKSVGEGIAASARTSFHAPEATK